MNCVIYARYSSDSQREESIEGQLRECQAYAQRRGLTVLQTYVDRAKTGKTHYYYKCSHAKNKRICNKKAIRKDWIENLVYKSTMEMLNNQGLIDYLVDTLFEMQKKESTELPLLRQQLSELEKSASNILNAIQQGVLNEFTKTRLDELTERKEQLETAILQEKIATPAMTKEQIHYWLDGFKALETDNHENRKRIIDIFVNAIYVYDDELKITFNCKDGVKHLSLQEFECSSLESSASPKCAASAAMNNE
jgi:hypothetical protein